MPNNSATRDRPRIFEGCPFCSEHKTSPNVCWLGRPIDRDHLVGLWNTNPGGYGDFGTPLSIAIEMKDLALVKHLVKEEERYGLGQTSTYIGDRYGCESFPAQTSLDIVKYLVEQHNWTFPNMCQGSDHRNSVMWTLAKRWDDTREKYADEHRKAEQLLDYMFEKGQYVEEGEDLTAYTDGPYSVSDYSPLSEEARKRWGKSPTGRPSRKRQMYSEDIPLPAKRKT